MADLPDMQASMAPEQSPMGRLRLRNGAQVASALLAFSTYLVGIDPYYSHGRSAQQDAVLASLSVSVGVLAGGTSAGAPRRAGDAVAPGG